MNTDRLLRLADFLDGLPPKKFCIVGWGRKYSGCGTVACAAGWACLIPEFVADGLHRFDESNFMPMYKECLGNKALALFFDIDGEKVYDLFFAGGHEHGSDTKAEEVAARIRELVASANPVIRSGEMPIQEPKAVKRSIKMPS